MIAIRLGTLCAGRLPPIPAAGSRAGGRARGAGRLQSCRDAASVEAAAGLSSCPSIFTKPPSGKHADAVFGLTVGKAGELQAADVEAEEELLALRRRGFRRPGKWPSSWTKITKPRPRATCGRSPTSWKALDVSSSSHVGRHEPCRRHESCRRRPRSAHFLTSCLAQPSSATNVVERMRSAWRGILVERPPAGVGNVGEFRFPLQESRGQPPRWPHSARRHRQQAPPGPPPRGRASAAGNRSGSGGSKSSARPRGGPSYRAGPVEPAGKRYGAS